MSTGAVATRRSDQRDPGEGVQLLEEGEQNAVTEVFHKKVHPSAFVGVAAGLGAAFGIVTSLTSLTFPTERLALFLVSTPSNMVGGAVGAAVGTLAMLYFSDRQDAAETCLGFSTFFAGTLAFETIVNAVYLSSGDFQKSSALDVIFVEVVLLIPSFSMGFLTAALGSKLPKWSGGIIAGGVGMVSGYVTGLGLGFAVEKLGPYLGSAQASFAGLAAFVATCLVVWSPQYIRNTNSVSLENF